jgi:hypothetical protein
MSISSGNGCITLHIGSQVLYWGTVASVFTADPIDADGVRLEAGSPLTAITVVAGTAVVNDATYYTWGEGPVSVIDASVDHYVYKFVHGSAEGTISTRVAP